MIAQAAAEVPGGGGEFHVIVLQHTDCGITRLPSYPGMLAGYFRIAQEQLGTKAVMDPRAALAIDLATLREASVLPSEWLVSGLVVDVATGLVDVVIPPAPV